MLKLFTRGALLFALTLLTACSTLDRSAAPTLGANALWVVLPFANNTETPLAGSRAEAIAESLLGAQDVGRVRRYPGAKAQEALFDAAGAREQREAALA